MKNSFERFKDEKLDTLKKFMGEQKSLQEISILLGLNRDTLRKYLKQLGIKYCGTKPKEHDAKYYLETGAFITASALRKKLLNEGIKEEKCECCGLSEWMGQKIPLELHHKNGIHTDNRLENLEILCSNCHGIKHGYSSYKKVCAHCGKEFITNVKQQKYCSIKCKNEHNSTLYTKVCQNCGKEFVTKRENQMFCSSKCMHEASKIVDITREDLIMLFKQYKTYLGVARQFGVSDRAVCKWCKKFGLPTNAKDMKEFLSRLD